MEVTLALPKFSTLNQTRGIGIYASQLQKNLPPEILNNSHSDITHFLNFDLFFLSLPLNKTTKWIVTIHDVIPLIFPKHFPSGIRGQIKFFLQKKGLLRTDAIITDSQNSKKDIIKYLNIPAPKIHVIHLGVDPTFHPLNILKKPFILYVGDVNYNKNVPALLEAFKLLKRPDLQLMLAGKVWDQSIPEVHALKQQIDHLGITQHVQLITNPNLPHLYNQAQVYIQPSLYEGFGLTVLESMACGTPVVATNTSSLPEVCGTAAILVNPTAQDIAAGLAQCLNLSPKQRQSHIKAGLAQAAKFTWGKTAHETIKVYNQALSS